jgi:glycosyltransferase involved in cell wall biosynthesis
MMPFSFCTLFKTERIASTTLSFLLFLTLGVFLFGFAEEGKPSQEQGVSKVRVLVGSPIRQKPLILKEFLESLARLSKKGYTLDYLFVDDNVVEESHDVLRQFQQKEAPCCRIEGPNREENNGEYVCNEITHFWKEDTVWKVAGFKDRIIEKARDEGYDYLFLIDSDIVLHPDTIDQLLSDKKDIVSNIFWTRFTPQQGILPQVWVKDFYTLWEGQENEVLTQAEIQQRTNAFLDRLKTPGVYEVGGLGACTLISKHALSKGVTFKRLKNLTFWGEDRHFCVRAVALGLSLFVDTHLPACHIYRDSLLYGVPHYKWACQVGASLPKVPSPRLTLSMVVKNEAGRFLRPVLESARKYITDAVIIDDASTDTTCEICEEVLKGLPLRIIHNTESKFSNEILLRKQQWEETIQTNPDWILILDADEIFEDKFAEEVSQMMWATDVDVYKFRLYDFWDESCYRDDAFWRAHLYYAPFMIRYKPELTYRWKETPQHCGRCPLTIFTLPSRQSNLRLKHYGWAREEDRIAKYERYQKLDPGARFGWKEQYDSILAPHPHLVPWEE